MGSPSGATLLRGPMAADHFTILHNLVYRGDLIHTKYVGVFGYIISNDEGFRLTEQRVADKLHVGRPFVRSALKNFEDAGCLIRTRERDPKGRLGDAFWFITDLPLQLRHLGVTDPVAIQERVLEEYRKARARCSLPMCENETLGLTIDNERFPRSGPMFCEPTLGQPTLENGPPKKNKKKEDQQEEDQPSLPDPSRTAPNVVGHSEGGRAEPDFEAESLVDAAPWPDRPPAPGDRSKLAVGVRHCLDVGHPADALAAELAAAMPGADDPVAVALKRLRALYGTRPAPVPAQREADGKTPHSYVPGPNGYCAECGTTEINRIHPRATRNRQASKCEHGKHREACPRCATWNRTPGNTRSKLIARTA